jgi:hypothetical protein
LHGANHAGGFGTGRAPGLEKISASERRR